MRKIIDLAGRTFGKLTVMGRTDDPRYLAMRETYRDVVCACGATNVSRGSVLTRGQALSCGCRRRDADLAGTVFGDLTVVGRAPDVRHGTRDYVAWRVRCACSAERVVAGRSLRSGNTRSCGCAKRRGRGAAA